jgi:hypothetical protein
MRTSNSDRRVRSAGLVVVGLALMMATGAAIGARQRRRTGGSTINAGAVMTRTVAAANAFLAGLDATQRAKAAYPFDSPQKTNWSNLPTGIFQRNSLRMGDLTAPQRDSLLALMSTVLSKDGYQKVTNIMNGDEVLKNRAAGAPEDGRGGGQRRARVRPGRVPIAILAASTRRRG